VLIALESEIMQRNDQLADHAYSSTSEAKAFGLRLKHQMEGIENS
jgi:hypothetical protein